MIELQRHIEILLLDNDCVIVPDFGGFVAHQVSARYDESDHTLLPPMRTLGFNPQLRMNDSLLAQSYATSYDISYPEALRRIEGEVGELRQQLSTEGEYRLENIGMLTVNSDGNIQFEPCEAGILSPAYYGLGACVFPRLKDTVAQAVQQQKQPAEEKDPTLLEFIDTPDGGHEERAIQIKMSWIRNTVAVAAAVVAFFLMATPIANSDLSTRTMSNLQNSLLTKLMPKDTNMTPATPVADAAAVMKAEEKTDSPQVAAKPAPADAPAQPAVAVKQADAPIYCIVLASHVKLSNAENYVAQLKERGMKAAEVYVHNHVVRVVYGTFQTEAEAYRQLNKLNNSEEFAEAWVYRRVES